MLRLPPLLLLILLGACAPPATVYRPASIALAEEPGTVRVELLDGRMVRVGGAAVVRDTLRGTLAETSQLVRVPMDSVRRISLDGAEPAPFLRNMLGSGVGTLLGVLLAFALINVI